MSLKDLLKDASIPAILTGVGAAALMPLLLEGNRSKRRPLIKALLHKYLDLAEKFSELSAEKQEEWRDLVAEVQAEREARRQDEVADVVEQGPGPGNSA